MRTMTVDKPTNQQWRDFAKRIIQTQGNPSTKDAEDCGIPFGVYFEIALTGRNTKESLIKKANIILERIEVKL